MSEHDPIDPDVVPAGYPYAEAGEEPHSAGPNPLQVIHSLLRGRYHWAILLGLGLAAVGATAGYKLPPLNYRSSGIVEIKPIRDRIVFQSEQNGLMPMFESFIESQTQLVSSSRVLQGAIRQLAWVQLKRPPTQKVVAEFRDSVEVEHPRNTQLMIISFNDRDPKAAYAGAKSVIDAYEGIFWPEGTESATTPLGILEELRKRKQNQQNDLIGQIREIAKKYATDSLQPMYEFQLHQWNAMRAEQAQVDLLLAGLPNRDEPVGAATQPSTRPAKRMPLTAEQIAPADPELQKLMAQRRETAASAERLKGVYGPQWRAVLEAQADLNRLDSEIAERVERFAQFVDSAGAGGADPQGSPATSPVTSLRIRAQNLKTLVAQADHDLKEIGEANLLLQDKRRQLDGVTTELAQITKRIEELTVESQSPARFRRISDPEEPIAPFKDKRMAISAGCGFGGGALGVALVAVFGLANRRFNTLADAQMVFDSSLRVLGVLPHLETKDAEQMATAAHCLHTIRTSLQIYSDSPDKRVFAITSPSPGAGKTSLTLALGLSFSAARSRTLMIDCDILGGGLSAKVRRGSPRKLGQVLVRAGRINQTSLEDGLTFARQHEVRLGEALVRMGRVDASDVTAALDGQRHSHVGLLDVLAGDPLEDCVMNLGVPGLSLLSLGEATSAHIAQLSPHAMRRIIETARNTYDTVLIDTGPLSGSLEAPVVCAEADSVMVVLPRGESYAMARDMLVKLKAAPFRLAGVVFNRATVRDMKTSGFSSSHRSQGSASWPRPALGVRTIPFDDQVRPDSIASAVASTTAARD